MWRTFWYKHKYTHTHTHTSQTDRRTWVVVFVDSVAEAHEFGFFALDCLDEGGDVLDGADAVCFWLCVCEREREREGVSVCMCVRERRRMQDQKKDSK